MIISSIRETIRRIYDAAEYRCRRSIISFLASSGENGLFVITSTLRSEILAMSATRIWDKKTRPKISVTMA